MSINMKKKEAYNMLRAIAKAMVKTDEYNQLSHLRQRVMISDIGEVIEKRLLPFGVRIESDAYRQAFLEFAPDTRFVCVDGHGWYCK